MGGSMGRVMQKHEVKQSMPKGPAMQKRRMSTDTGYMLVKPQKVGLKEVIKEVPGATKKVLGKLGEIALGSLGVKAAQKTGKFIGSQIKKDQEFKRQMYSPKTPLQKKAAEYLKNK